MQMEAWTNFEITLAGKDGRTLKRLWRKKKKKSTDYIELKFDFCKW